MEKFDKEKFAVWMQEGFAASPAKSQAELVKAVKSNPATISRLMSGAPQTTNNKASQPPPDLVKRLAIFFKKNVDDALVLAGHAPESNILPEPLKTSDFEGFDEEDMLDIRKYVLFRVGFNLCCAHYVQN